MPEAEKKVAGTETLLAVEAAIAEIRDSKPTGLVAIVVRDGKVHWNALNMSSETVLTLVTRFQHKLLHVIENEHEPENSKV